MTQHLQLRMEHHAVPWGPNPGEPTRARRRRPGAGGTHSGNGRGLPATPRIRTVCGIPVPGRPATFTGAGAGSSAARQGTPENRVRRAGRSPADGMFCVSGYCCLHKRPCSAGTVSGAVFPPDTRPVGAFPCQHPQTLPGSTVNPIRVTGRPLSLSVSRVARLGPRTRLQQATSLALPCPPGRRCQGISANI